MKIKLSILSVLAPLLLSSSAFAQVYFAPAPDTTLIMGSDMFKAGQSNNIGPAVNQVLDNYWIKGACPAEDDPNDYTKCDALRFGFTVFPPASCTQDINVQVVPHEDGGKPVEDRVKSIHNEGGTTWCNTEAFRPHDSALQAHHQFTFPNGTSASDTELDNYWERPRLSLMFIGDLPQTNNATPANRVIETLRTACRNFEGAGGILPSMPTWTFITRKFDTEAVPYAGLVAAAGGTGTCCYGAGCDPIADAIDVCSHIEDGRTDGDIRDDIKAGRYTCGADGSTHGTGQIDFGTSNKGTLPEIRCHLVGTENNDNCSAGNRKPTDILGIFACVRQLPRGVSADDANFLYCPNSDPADCMPLSDAGGTIQWIDDNKTLYLVEGVSCDSVAVTTCDENAPCIVENAFGRCRIGRISCDTGREVCESKFQPMPEICNGLDDSCDGNIDNMYATWNDPSFANFSMPTEHEGKECNVQDICMCPDGATDLHAGDTFEEYLDAWGGACTCGEGLAPAEQPEPAATPLVEDGAACSAVTQPGRALEAGFMSLMLLGFGMFVRRRTRR